jgi:hypothetical protein
MYKSENISFSTNGCKMQYHDPKGGLYAYMKDIRGETSQ